MFEIPERASRRDTFTKEQRWLLLVEYEKCLDRGAKAAFCRRIQVNQSTVRDWVKARDEGRLGPPVSSGTQTSAGRSFRMNKRDRDELEHLRRENAKLKAKLEKSEAAVDILGKASALLEAMAKSAKATDPHLEELEPGRPDWLRKDGESS